jgi:coenzyme F420-reducing hydrogenase beta subunit
MSTVCPADQCTGCRACEAICPKKAIRLVDSVDKVYAEINEELCVHCGMCERVCPNHNLVQKNEPIEWHQGWANDTEIRKTSSSGGIAAALTQSFIENGGYVCSCYYDKGEFNFHTTNSTKEAHRFAGSKYVKTNPFDAYKDVEKLLKNGERVLFIGLPCQVAAIKNYISEKLHEELYCIDLICHGTPSVELLKIFLAQHSVDIASLADFKFRSDGGMGININSVTTAGTVDRYLISFLNALNYTEGCYNCKFACKPRVSDITLGDNWGTELQGELHKGLSLILCITEKGQKLLEYADVKLLDVNIEKAVEGNGQLKHASTKPAQRDAFFAAIKNGAKYDRLILKIFPKQCIRQIIKGIAIKTHLKK